MNEEQTPPSDVKPLCDLSTFRNPEYKPGRGVFVRTLWYYCSLLLFESGWLPVSGFKVRILRLFWRPNRQWSGVQTTRPH